MKAKFPSVCPCGRPIAEGDEIRIAEVDGAERWTCSGCGFTGKRRIVVDLRDKRGKGSLAQSMAKSAARRARGR